MHRSASLKVEEWTVLTRSTEAEPNAADAMNQGIALLTVNFAPEPPNINVNNVGRRIEMQVPYVLQEHGARDHLTGIAGQVRQ